MNLNSELTNDDLAIMIAKAVQMSGKNKWPGWFSLWLSPNQLTARAILAGAKAIMQLDMVEAATPLEYAKTLLNNWQVSWGY